jgi:hypothetical protein
MSHDFFHLQIFVESHLWSITLCSGLVPFFLFYKDEKINGIKTQYVLGLNVLQQWAGKIISSYLVFLTMSLGSILFIFSVLFTTKLNFLDLLLPVFGLLLFLLTCLIINCSLYYFFKKSIAYLPISLICCTVLCFGGRPLLLKIFFSENIPNIFLFYEFLINLIEGDLSAPFILGTILIWTLLIIFIRKIKVERIIR